MALFDAAGLFSENQVITATAVSTNSIDFGAAGTPVGALGAVVAISVSPRSTSSQSSPRFSPR